MRRSALILLAAGALVATAAPTPAAPAKPGVVTVVVGNKGVVGGSKRITVKKGRRVVLVVRSALGGEVHVHGYDIKRMVRPGGSVRLAFRCGVAGRFEVELHARVPLRLAVLEVRP